MASKNRSRHNPNKLKQIINAWRPSHWIQCWTNKEDAVWVRVLIFFIYYPVVIPFGIVVLVIEGVRVSWLLSCLLVSRHFPEKKDQELRLDIPWDADVHVKGTRQYPQHLPEYAVRELPRTRQRNLTLLQGTHQILEANTRASQEMVVVDTVDLEMGLRKFRNTERSDGTKANPTLQQTIGQGKVCTLWRLPPEVREIIWTYAVGGSHVHIVHRKGRLGSVYCPLDDPTDPVHRDICVMNKEDGIYYRPSAWPLDTRPLSLLVTCRQIYSEAVKYLYSSNTFAFDNSEVLETFFRNVLPCRHPHITSIHLAPLLDRQERNKPAKRSHIFRLFLYQHWGVGLETLSSIPNLALSRITITPRLNKWCLDTYYRRRDALWIQETLKAMNNFAEKSGCSVTLAWDPREVDPQINLPPQIHLPTPLHLSLRSFETPPESQVRNFSFPMDVQCLHCYTPHIIKRETKAWARFSIIDRDTSVSSSWVPLRECYQWWHRPCGGTIEFQYDVIEKSWTLTGGAQEVDHVEMEETNQRTGEETTVHDVASE